MRNKNQFRAMIGVCFLFLAFDELQHSIFNRLAIVKLLPILFSVLYMIVLRHTHDFPMPQHCTTLQRDGDLDFVVLQVVAFAVYGCDNYDPFRFLFTQL